MSDVKAIKFSVGDLVHVDNDGEGKLHGFTDNEVNFLIDFDLRQYPLGATNLRFGVRIVNKKDLEFHLLVPENTQVEPTEPFEKVE